MDTRSDNEESKMGKAEGSPENVNPDTSNPKGLGSDANVPMERGAGQVSHPEKPLPGKGSGRPPHAKGE